MTKRLLPLFLLLCLVPSAYSQMGVARAVAKTPGVPPTPCYAGAIRFNAANNGLYLCGPNSTWTKIGTGGSSNVTGGGTANQIPLWLTATDLGNSNLYFGTNLIEQKNTTSPQTFRVYGTTANTGEVAQIQALTSDNTVRFGSKILNAAATGRPAEFGYENASATFLGWQVTTSGHLNPSSSNTATEIGSSNSPKILHLGGVGNGTAQIQMIGNTGGSGTLTLSIPDTVTTHTLKFPSAQGAASSVLTNDGSGNLSWGTGGGVTGSGTSGRITAWTGSSSVGSSTWAISQTDLIPDQDNAGAFPAIGSASKRIGTIYLQLGQSINLYNSTNSLGGTAVGGELVIGATDQSVNNGAAKLMLNETSADNSTAPHWLLRPGRGRGTGTPSRIHLQGAAAGTASGSTQHEFVDRYVTNGTLALSAGSATTLFTVGLASGGMTGGAVRYSVESSDGTSKQVCSGQVFWSGVNSSASYTTNITTAPTEICVSESGTLADTWGISTGTNLINIRVTPTVTVITPTVLRITYSVENFGEGAVSIQ